MGKLKAEHQVNYAVARWRVLQYLASLANRRDLLPANAIAGHIWPDHNMRSQGAGGAASRILRRMADEGLVRWTSERSA